MKTENHQFTHHSLGCPTTGPATGAVSTASRRAVLRRGLCVLSLGACLILGAAPGDLKWSYSTGGAIINTCPAIGPDGSVYVGCSAPTLFAVNGATGKLKWEFNSGDGVRFASPTLGPNGTLYVGTLNGRVYAVDAATGQKKWQFEATTYLDAPWNYVNTTPALSADGIVYFGSANHRAYGVNAASGQKIWEFLAGDGIHCSPAIGADGTVYIGSDDGRLYALNGTSGTKKWGCVLGGPPTHSSPALGTDGTVYIGCDNGKVYAVNAVSGTRLWESAVLPNLIWDASPVIGVDGTVYAATSALDGKRGDVKWSFAGGTVNGTPAIGADGTVYVGTDDSRLYALSGGSGQKLWEYKARQSLHYSVPALGPDGTVYFCDGNGGTLYAVEGNTAAGLATSPWPKFHNNRANTGVPMTGPLSIRLDVRALIDGVDFLIVQGRTLQWDHSSWAAVGRYGGQNEPTYLSLAYGATTVFTNLAWVPTWPTPPPDEIRSPALSSVFDNGAWFLPRAEAAVTVQSVEARGEVSIAQAPAPTNNYTLRVKFNDDALGGSEWYHVRLVIDTSQLPNVGSPVILFQPSSLRVMAGSNATFQVVASGGPPLTFQWQKNRTNIPVGQGTSSGPADASVQTNILTLTRVQPSDAGDYRVVISNSAGTLTSLEARLAVISESDRLIWTLSTAGQVESSAAIGTDNTIYIGSTDGRLYAIEGATGQQRWAYETAGGIYSAPALGTNGLVYFGSFDNKVYAVEMADGSKRWEFTTRDCVFSSPAIGADGTVYVGSDDGMVYALSGATGRKQWEFAAGDDVRSSPAIGLDNTIYVGSWDNRLYALDGATGAKKWAFTARNWVWSSPAVGRDGTVYVGSYDGRVYALNSTNGQQKWSFETGGWVWGSPTVGPDGTVYVGSFDGKVYALDGLSGTLRWQFRTDGPVRSSPALSTDNTLYVGNEAYYGTVYALDAGTGQKRWEYKTQGMIYSSPALGPDGTIYIGSNDRKVYALLGSPANLTPGVWPKFRGNAFNTGLAASLIPAILIHHTTNEVIVSTLAGTGQQGFADGPGAQAQFIYPNGGFADARGNVYVADFGNHRIRKVAPDGTVSTVAGTGVPGYLDGPGDQAMFNQPLGVWLDPAGTVYVADTGNNRIRKITLTGQVTTVAGSGLPGYVDGVGTAAWFDFPNDLVTDAAGNLFVCEFNNHTVRTVTPDGAVSTWVGNGTAGYVDGPRAEARLNQPGGIAIDRQGNLYISEWDKPRIRKVSAEGQVTTLAGRGAGGYVDGPGLQALFNNPDGMVLDSQGYLYVADNGNQAIRRISPAGVVETVAGTGVAGYADGEGARAQFAYPSGIGLDAMGTLYVTDWGNQRVRQLVMGCPVVITQQPQNQTVALGANVTFSVSATGTLPLFYQWQKDGGDLPGANTNLLLLSNVSDNAVGSYRVSVSNRFGVVLSAVAVLTVTNPVRFLTNQVSVSSWAGSGQAGFADGPGGQAQFNTPNGGCVDGDGNVYVADSGNHRIRKVSPEGVVTTLAGSGVAGSRDGPAAQAAFSQPLGVCVDARGTVYVADTGNNRIRKLTPAGEVSTVAGSGLAGYVDGVGTAAWFDFPNDLVTDAAGNLFISEFNNHTIRKITPDGMVTTWVGNGTAGYADGLGTSARLNRPGGIAIDEPGNLYVGEWGNQRIRKISPAGQVTTLAGSGVAGYVDGIGLQAQFNNPDGIVADPLGNLLITENGNQVIRRISPAGAVETVAGRGSLGYGDGSGMQAQFAYPSGIGLDGSGTLYVTDWGNQRIRQIAVAWPLTITRQPQSQTVAAGSDVMLSVSAWGALPLSYQWQFQGTNILGATNRTLSLTNVNASRPGGYAVVVSNPDGSVLSVQAQVTAWPWLRITRDENDLRLEYRLSQQGGQAAIYQAESLEGLKKSPLVLVTLEAKTDSGTLSLTNWASQAARFFVLSEGVQLNLPAGAWVWIPPGTFLMGSPATEGSQTQVTISRGFWMSRREVTQTEYQSVMRTNPSVFAGHPERPVERVSWFDATNYCGRLTAQERAAGRLPAGYGYRLPTEAEWEYACRAGTTTRFSFGDDPAYTQLTDYAWYSSNSGYTTQSVGQKLPNPWGLYDMHGNVDEWCSDWFGPYLAGSVIDPQGPAIGSDRVIRGGNWVCEAQYCQSAARNTLGPDSKYSNIGFRSVLAPSE